MRFVNQSFVSVLTGLTLRGQSGSGEFFPIGFQDVAFLLSRAMFYTISLKTVVEVISSTPPHVL